jgi:arylsulfatase A
MALTHCPFCPTPDSEDWDPKSRGSKDYKGDPQYFADMVSYVDKTISKIDSNLKKLGIRENTLLIFIGDNGTDTPIVTNTTFGKIVGAKGRMKDGGNRVPCIVSWPGHIQSGKVVKTIADLSDIIPTICDAASIKLPSGIPFDGKSFLPILQGDAPPHRDAITMWYARNGGPNAQIFARNADYKLYSTGQFYHVAEDRLEKNDLSHTEHSGKTQGVYQMLQAKLDEYEQVEYLGETAEKGPPTKKKKAKVKDK